MTSTLLPVFPGGFESEAVGRVWPNPLQRSDSGLGLSVPTSIGSLFWPASGADAPGHHAMVSTRHQTIRIGIHLVVSIIKDLATGHTDVATTAMDVLRIVVA